MIVSLLGGECTPIVSLPPACRSMNSITSAGPLMLKSHGLPSGGSLSDIHGVVKVMPTSGCRLNVIVGSSDFAMALAFKVWPPPRVEYLGSQVVRLSDNFKFEIASSPRRAALRNVIDNLTQLVERRQTVEDARVDRKRRARLRRRMGLLLLHHRRPAAAVAAVARGRK